MGSRSRVSLGPLLAGVISVAALTAGYAAWLGLSNPTLAALSFLLVVLIIAAVSTRLAAIATALVAFLCFNYFFLPPVRTWSISDPQNWMALFTFLAVSIVASHLSSSARRRALEATARKEELGRLFRLTRDILPITPPDVASLVAGRVAQHFQLGGAAICLPQGDGWEVHGSTDRSGWLEQALGQASMERHVQVHTPSGEPVWLVPMRVGSHSIGILALPTDRLEPGTRDAIAGVTAVAMDRGRLLAEREEGEIARRSTELKSALLASLAHDLKTPLTAATVAADGMGALQLTDAERQEQAEILRAELRRLGQLFQDFVDLARIEARAVRAEPEWVGPGELVEAASRQAERALRTHDVELLCGPEGVLVRLDPRLTSAALAHLLENAGQYAPAGSPITVHVDLAGEELRIAVRDRGQGVAPGDLEHIFDRFYRGVEARRRRFGSGLGLAIARGLLATQGGRAWVENHPDGGAVFTIALPVEQRTIDAVEEESREPADPARR